MNAPLMDVMKTCLITTIIFYGSWHLLTESLRTVLPFSIILTAFLGLVVYFLRIPPPSIDAVEAIVGKEPHLETSDYIMKTVAHRGAGFDAPENSLAAFNMCKDKGCDAIEFDLTLTRDEVPIIFHDFTLERMTDVNFVVNETKWDDLTGIDISVKHPFKERFVKTNIPTLDQTVTLLLANNQRMFIDIKDNNTKLVGVVHRIFEKYPDLYSRAVVSSFFPYLIYLIRKGNPKIVCSLAWRPCPFAYESYSYPEGKGNRRASSLWLHYLLCLCDIVHEWALPKITYYLTGISILLLHKDAVSGYTILEWRKRGVRVMAWTANNPVEKQYFARFLKITYLTDTLTGEATTHSPPI